MSRNIWRGKILSWGTALGLTVVKRYPIIYLWICMWYFLNVFETKKQNKEKSLIAKRIKKYLKNIWCFSTFFSFLLCKTCSYPFVRFFRTLVWDDFMIICWWKLSKKTSYWSKTGLFFSLKKVNIFIRKCQDIIAK